jgi:hypothetical protein
MRRKTFDTLVSTAGLLIAVVLLAAGGLLTWAHSFIDTQVHSQLSAQQIYFPKAGDDALKPKEIGPYLNQYAGQQLTTGDQAKAYADHFIAVHINEMTGGKTYSQVSAAAMADPKNAQLQGVVATVFKGETLRGLLLNAYAFGKMGQIALIGALVSFGGAAIFLFLSLIGFAHRGRVAIDDELFHLGSKTPATVEP